MVPLLNDLAVNIVQLSYDSFEFRAWTFEANTQVIIPQIHISTYG